MRRPVRSAKLRCGAARRVAAALLLCAISAVCEDIVYTFKGIHFVLVSESATFESAAAACESHAALPRGEGTLISPEVLVPMFMDLYMTDTALGQRLLIAIATAKAAWSTEPAAGWDMWVWDRSRPCRASTNVYGRLEENSFVTAFVPCSWRLTYVCMEAQPAAALGMELSTPWLARYREAAAAPSPYAAGPTASGLRLVRSGLIIGDPAPHAATTVAFDETDAFWAGGPVTGALYRGAEHNLYALKPLRESDRLDAWALALNQSAITAFFGVNLPERDGGAPFELLNTVPAAHDYVVSVQGCFRGPEVERLLLVTRSGWRYQMGRGSCTVAFREDAPEGGYLAGFAGAYMDVSTWPPGPPPYPEDVIFIRQLRLIWAAPASGSGTPQYSTTSPPPAVGKPSCPNARPTAVGGVGQPPAECGPASGRVCPTQQCCAGFYEPGVSAASMTCGTSLGYCQINCKDRGSDWWGLCGEFPESPAVLFVHGSAVGGPAALHINIVERFNFNDAVKYCRSMSYMGLSWSLINSTDVYALLTSLEVRRKAYEYLGKQRFWVAMQGQASPAIYPCLIGAYGASRSIDSSSLSFYPTTCPVASGAICRADAAQNSSTLAGARALPPAGPGGGGLQGWAPGLHEISLSRTLGGGPFGPSCAFSLGASDGTGNASRPPGSSLPAATSWPVPRPLASLAVSIAVDVLSQTDSSEQIAGLRLSLGPAGAHAPPDDASAATAGTASSEGWHALQLAQGEVVVAVSGCAGGFVERLVLHTSAGRLWTTKFTRTSVCSSPFVEAAPAGAYLVGVQGYFGTYLELLQLVWGRPLPAPPGPPSPPSPPAEPTQATRGGGGGPAPGLVAGVVAGGTAAAVLLLCALLVMCCRRQRLRRSLDKLGCAACVRTGAGAGKGGAAVGRGSGGGGGDEGDGCKPGPAGGVAGLVVDTGQSFGSPQDAGAVGQRSWQQEVQDAAAGLSVSVLADSLHGLTPPHSHSSAVGIYLAFPEAGAWPLPASMVPVRLSRFTASLDPAGGRAAQEASPTPGTGARAGATSGGRPPLNHSPLPRWLGSNPSSSVARDMQAGSSMSPGGGSGTTGSEHRLRVPPSQSASSTQAERSLALGQHVGPFDAGPSMNVVMVPHAGEEEAGLPAELQMMLGRDVEVDGSSLLGRGGSGVVRRGTLLLADGARVAVAVKILDVGVDGGGDDDCGGRQPLTAHIRTFARELYVLSRLAHPNVVRFYGGSLDSHRPFIVEELCTMSLNRVIHEKDASGGPLHPYGLPDVLRLLRDIAAGLAYLHPTVVHRDLKPGNVLLDGNGVAKIGDFGLARFKQNTALATTDVEVGTAAYMAPEQFLPAELKVSDRTDVYSLGMTAWELVTRQRPWARTRNAVIGYTVAVVRARPDLPEPGDPLCPPALRSLIERCWRHNPDERPSSPEILKRLTLLYAEFQGAPGAPSRSSQATTPGGSAQGSGRGSLNTRAQAAGAAGQQ